MGGGIFISMTEALEKVLDRFVVANFDRLVGVKVKTFRNLNDAFIIIYYINDRIDYQYGYNVEKETRRMFNMLSPDGNDSFIIEYKMVED